MYFDQDYASFVFITQFQLNSVHRHCFSRDEVYGNFTMSENKFETMLESVVQLARYL